MFLSLITLFYLYQSTIYQISLNRKTTYMPHIFSLDCNCCIPVYLWFIRLKRANLILKSDVFKTLYELLSFLVHLRQCYSEKIIKL